MKVSLRYTVILLLSTSLHHCQYFKVEGCADPDLPDTMWVKRFTHEALVGCKAGLQTTWLLKCVRGVWEGQVGICSSSAASAPVLAQPKNKGTRLMPSLSWVNKISWVKVANQLCN